MQGLVYILFLSIFFTEFLERYGLGIRELTYAAELVSIAALLAIVLYWAPKNRVLYLNAWYPVIFALLAIVIVGGIVLNGVPTTTIVVGTRNFLKYIPFFLLPVFFHFSKTHIDNQLRFLLVVAFLQIPIAVYQRFVQTTGTSGDLVRGTFNSSSHLSIYLICVIAIVVAYRVRRYLSLRAALVIGALLLFPTTINETKGTLFLLPFALLVPMFFLPGNRGKYKRMLGLMVAMVVFVGAYVPIYDHFMMPRYGESIISYVTSDERFLQLLAPQTLEINEKRTGRVDVLLSPFVNIKEPLKLMFGLGMGNVSESFLGREFNGEYYEEYGGKIFLALSHMLYELGILGTLLVIVLWIRIFMDALAIRHIEGVRGALALGWLGVMVVLGVSWGYKDIITAQQLSYPFWLYGGYLASERMRETENLAQVANNNPGRVNFPGRYSPQSR